MEQESFRPCYDREEGILLFLGWTDEALEGLLHSDLLLLGPEGLDRVTYRQTRLRLSPGKANGKEGIVMTERHASRIGSEIDAITLPTSTVAGSEPLLTSFTETKLVAVNVSPSQLSLRDSCCPSPSPSPCTCSPLASPKTQTHPISLPEGVRDQTTFLPSAVLRTR